MFVKRVMILSKKNASTRKLLKQIFKIGMGLNRFSNKDFYRKFFGLRPNFIKTRI